MARRFVRRLDVLRSRRSPIPTPVALSITASSVGQAVGQLSIAWAVLRLTGSPLTISLVFTLRAAPRFLFGIPAGGLGDRIGRARSIVIANALAGTVVAALVVEGVGARFRLPALLAAAAVLGCSDALQVANSQALVDGTQPGGHGATLASLNLTTQSAMLVGAFVGGALLPPFGAAATLGLAAVCNLGALLAMSQVPQSRLDQTGRPVASLRAGLDLLRRNMAVRALAAYVVAAEICVVSSLALLPAFTRGTLRGGASSLGC